MKLHTKHKKVRHKLINTKPKSKKYKNARKIKHSNKNASEIQVYKTYYKNQKQKSENA